MSERLATRQAELNEQAAAIQSLKSQVATLEEQESKSDMQVPISPMSVLTFKLALSQAELNKLKALVMLNEQFKQQENAFKANCKRQLTNLQGILRVTPDYAPCQHLFCSSIV